MHCEIRQDPFRHGQNAECGADIDRLDTLIDEDAKRRGIVSCLAHTVPLRGLSPLVMKVSSHGLLVTARNSPPTDAVELLRLRGSRLFLLEHCSNLLCIHGGR